jgi:hypothetical protein
LTHLDAQFTRNFKVLLFHSICYLGYVLEPNLLLSSKAQSISQFPSKFCLVLSSNGHNQCSVYRHETREYSSGKFEEDVYVFDVQSLWSFHFEYWSKFKIVSSSNLFNAEFQQRSSTSLKHIT